MNTFICQINISRIRYMKFLEILSDWDFLGCKNLAKIWASEGLIFQKFPNYRTDNSKNRDRYIVETMLHISVPYQPLSLTSCWCWFHSNSHFLQFDSRITLCTSLNFFYVIYYYLEFSSTNIQHHPRYI